MTKTYYLPVEGLAGISGYSILPIEAEDAYDAFEKRHTVLNNRSYKSVWFPRATRPTEKYMQQVEAEKSSRRNLYR
jgi:hypothetical protein